MSSFKVREAFTNLFDSVVVELNSSIQNNDWSEFNWNKHEMMCFLIVQIVDYGENVIIGKHKNKIFDYIANIVDNCRYSYIVSLITHAFKAFSKNKIENWLVKRLNLLSKELDYDEINWRKHENTCQVLLTMLEIIFRSDIYKKYYQNLFEPLINLVTEYLVKILDFDEHNHTMLLAILILEMMDIKKILSIKWRKVLISKLTKKSKFIKPNLSLYPNFQLNQSDHDQQIQFCARWCLENVLNKNYQENELPLIKLSPDRFDARNDYYQSVPVRSAFAVVSGVYYYEVTLLTVGQMFIGWSALDTLFSEYDDRHHAMGRGKNSIGFVTSKKYILHDNKDYEIPNMPTLELHDVIGCLIDVNNQRFVFYHNGKCIFDKIINYDFLFSIFYATVNFSFHQQCHFNFGQHEFKHFPQNIEFKTFYKFTNGDARKYRLLETENVEDLFWFKNILIDNQIALPFSTLNVARFLRKPRTNYTLKDFLIYIQMLLEYDFKMDEIISLIAVFFNDNIGNDKVNTTIYCVKLWELLYPFTQLQVNSTNKTLCRNVCFAIVVVLQILTISQFIYKTCIKFLLSNKFFSVEIFENFPRILTNALNSLYEFEFQEEDRQILLNDQSLVSTLQWCFKKYIQVENVSYLYEKNCDFVGLQTGQCARWFYEKVLSCKESQAVSTFVRQATLNPFDRSLRLKLTSDRLSARSYWAWQSVRSIAYARSDIYYFEVILVTDGPMRIGWATKRTDLNETELGKDNFSVSYDGFNRCVRHNSEVYQLPDLPRWEAGDVIGCLIDKGTKHFSFSLNGRPISLPHEFFFSKHQYHAGISLAHQQQAYFNFGQAKFKYAPEHIDYISFHLALEYYKTNQPVIDLQNVNNSIISYNADVRTGDILIRQQMCQLLHSAQSNFHPQNQPNSDLGTNLISIENYANFNNPPNSSSTTKCSQCFRTNPKRLLCFVCCSKVIRCLHCVRQLAQCPRCLQMGFTHSANNQINAPQFECRLCSNQTKTELVFFVTSDPTMSNCLCLDCIKGSSEGKKQTDKSLLYLYSLIVVLISIIFFLVINMLS